VACFLARSITTIFAKIKQNGCLNIERACRTAIDIGMRVVRLKRLGLPKESRRCLTYKPPDHFAELCRKMHDLSVFEASVHNYNWTSTSSKPLSTNAVDLRNSRAWPYRWTILDRSSALGTAQSFITSTNLAGRFCPRGFRSSPHATITKYLSDTIGSTTAKGVFHAQNVLKVSAWRDIRRGVVVLRKKDAAEKKKTTPPIRQLSLTGALVSPRPSPAPFRPPAPDDRQPTSPLPGDLRPIAWLGSHAAGNTTRHQREIRERGQDRLTCFSI
jgi:hypothetical protein